MSVGPIRRLLVANRGEIALRIFRTARRMGMQTGAVYAGPDAGALHVREADFGFALGGRTSAESYLRIDRLLEAARATGADAVHPGYGFLSENADFAQAVSDAGLAWVGPPAAAIRQLGSKSRCKALAESRGVPCLPGYRAVEGDAEGQSDNRLAHEAVRIGFPLMVKATAGGGGRGMRLVNAEAQLLAALQAARSEALSAFGSGELLLERALSAPRHVEVQVFADRHGHCIHLGERDCSVQRRHQKLIEETPSPAVDAALRERMGRCAVELARAAGYEGAGTVEFLLEEGEFFLMEMNTRLQVEHPVTEAVTGLDLVEWQLRVAQGEPLPLTQEQVAFDGHAIEARLCAEDEHFTPHAGRVLHFRAPAGVRFDHALFEGLDVPPYYDSMLGKLVAHAPTRAGAVAQLAGALDRLELLGLPTNRRLLAACLRDPVFEAGGARIPFLAQKGGELRDLLQKEERLKASGCGLQALFASNPPRGPGSPFVKPLRMRHRGETIELQMREADVVLPPGGHAVRMPDGRWHAQSGGIDLFFEDTSFDPPEGAGASASSGALRAPFNGRVVSLAVKPGDAFSRGDTLLVLESMKLEHALAAPRDGVVQSVQVEGGQQATTSQVLVTFVP